MRRTVKMGSQELEQENPIYQRMAEEEKNQQKVDKYSTN